MSKLQNHSELYKNGEVYGKAGKVCYDTICMPGGDNALHVAARSGKIEAYRFLIENLKFDDNGAIETSTNGVPEGDTTLFLSVRNKHRPTILIENDVGVNKWTVLGETPLHYAAKFGSEEILKLILSKGAALNASSGNHFSFELKADLNPSKYLYLYSTMVYR